MSKDIDFFSDCSLQQVHDWYLDLAKKISNLTEEQSTASKLLEYYLNPNRQKKDKKIINFCENEIEGTVSKNGEPNCFGSHINKQAGTYEELDTVYLNKIKKYTEYKKVMKEMLEIFLSKKTKSKGVVKHIKDKGLKDEYELSYYKSLGFSKEDKILHLLPLASNLKSDSKLSDSDKDRLDIYVGLNTFAIKAKTVVSINNIIFDEIKLTETTNLSKIKSVNVSIKSWTNILFDYYDFNKNIGFPLPNPHYGTGEIHPEIENVSFSQIHEGLVQMTKCNPPLANPFYIYKEFSEDNSELLIKNIEIEF